MELFAGDGVESMLFQWYPPRTIFPEGAPMLSPATVRSHEAVEWQVEDDYLASRGYPMTPHNRQIVQGVLSALSKLPERKALFRYLDSQLMPRAPRG